MPKLTDEQKFEKELLMMLYELIREFPTSISDFFPDLDEEKMYETISRVKKELAE